MFGPIGGMLIDKGIDQFSWGVGQEYKRHERHAIRDYQVHDNQNVWKQEFKQKMDMARRYGLHPLAMLNTGTKSSPTISVGGSMAPSGGTGPRMAPKINPSEQRILDANARKAEAEADIMEDRVKNMGQNPDNFGVGQAPYIDGQGDSDMYAVNPPGENPIGVERQVSKGQKYTTDREGNFYIIPSQSAEQAFSDEGTIQNRFLYQMRDARFPGRVHALKKDWSNPSKQEFKHRFLSTRPKSNRPDTVVLWNGTNWQAFRKTPQNKNKIFSTGVRQYKPKFKKRRLNNETYLDYPMGS